jgi:hypothetical protein
MKQLSAVSAGELQLSQNQNFTRFENVAYLNTLRGPQPHATVVRELGRK